MPNITLYFLQASRSIRIAWVLEELGLDYEVKFADRESGKAPQWLKDEAGGLGKFPTLRDGDVLLYESGNITEYVDPKYVRERDAWLISIQILVRQVRQTAQTPPTCRRPQTLHRPAMGPRI